MARNEGKSSGLLGFNVLSITLKHPDQVPRDRLELWPTDEAFLIEAGKDAHIKMAFRERLPGRAASESYG